VASGRHYGRRQWTLMLLCATVATRPDDDDFCRGVAEAGEND